MKKKRVPPKEQKSIGEKIGAALDISSDILMDIPRITLNDNKEMQVENYKSVIEYEESSIKLNTKNYIIKIMGKNLEIVYITDEEINIRGSITSISFAN